MKVNSNEAQFKNILLHFTKPNMYSLTFKEQQVWLSILKTSCDLETDLEN